MATNVDQQWLDELSGTKSTMRKGKYPKITWKDSIFLTTNAVPAGTKSQLKPENLTHKSYDEVVAVAHAVYKLTVICHRNQFMNRNRKPSESVSHSTLWPYKSCVATVNIQLQFSWKYCAMCL